MGSSTATQIKTNDINEHNFTSTQRDHILSKNDVNINTDSTISGSMNACSQFSSSYEGRICWINTISTIK